ncbi:MAG: transposase [Victivallales bacterium]
MDTIISQIKAPTDDNLSFLVPFDFANALDISERNLPHWQQEKVTYFITFRLADSLPQEKLKQLKAEQENWLRHHNEPYSNEEIVEYNILFNEKIQSWLDAGHGSCILKDSLVSKIVEDALIYFNGTRYLLHEWVVMPNHLHILLTPINDFSLVKIMHSLKSYTANKINKSVGRSGKLWKDESYDHIVRNLKQFNAISKYIIMNPVKARPKTGFRSSSKEEGNEIQRHRQDACATLLRK